MSLPKGKSDNVGKQIERRGKQVVFGDGRLMFSKMSWNMNEGWKNVSSMMVYMKFLLKGALQRVFCAFP